MIRARIMNPGACESDFGSIFRRCVRRCSIKGIAMVNRFIQTYGLSIMNTILGVKKERLVSESSKWSF
jgi:hypothetical protein